MDEIMNDTDAGQKSLLEQVRGKPLGMYRYHHDPAKPDDYGMAKVLNPIGLDLNKSIEVIRNHKKEFPPKIQEAIEDNSLSSIDDESPEDAFFINLKKAMTWYLLGENAGLAGLYNSKESMDQVELVLRFNPMHLNFDDLLHYTFYWIQDEATIRLVPLFVRLALEVKEPDKEMDQLDFLMKYLFVKNSEGVPNPILAKSSLSVMRQLKEMISWDVESHGKELVLRLYSAVNIQEDPDAFEERLRLLIGWNPSLLVPGAVHPAVVERTSSTLLSDGGFREFRVLFELGMLHYPSKLGFAFTNYPRQLESFFAKNANLGDPYNEFSVACHKFGPEKVSKVVYETIMKYLGTIPSSKLQAFVVTVVANDTISKDGVLCLVRCTNSLIRSESQVESNKFHDTSTTSRRRGRGERGPRNLRMDTTNGI